MIEENLFDPKDSILNDSLNRYFLYCSTINSVSCSNCYNFLKLWKSIINEKYEL